MSKANPDEVENGGNDAIIAPSAVVPGVILHTIAGTALPSGPYNDFIQTRLRARGMRCGPQCGPYGRMRSVSARERRVVFAFATAPPCPKGRQKTRGRPDGRPRVILFIFALYFTVARQRNVTTWALVQVLPGANEVLLTPAVTPFSTAHSTA